MSNDYALTTFDPQGKLKGIENAYSAAMKGYASIAIKSRTGLVLFAEKERDKLINQALLRKAFFPSKNLAMIYSGIGCDFTNIKAKANKITEKYFLEHDTDIPPEIFVKKLSKYIHKFTKLGGVRPFGLCLLVCGYKESDQKDFAENFFVYLVDPAGLYSKLKAAAIGLNFAKISENLRRNIEGVVEESDSDALEKCDANSYDINDAISIGLNVLKENNNGTLDPTYLEVSVFDDPAIGFRVLTKKELYELIQSLN